MPEPRSDSSPPERGGGLPEFLASLWGLRWLLLAVAVLATVIYWGAVLTSAPEREWVPTYSRVVYFSFDTAGSGRYPNGMPFNLGDVIAPRVIGELYEVHGLAERGVDARDFAQGFAIAPHMPQRDAITAHYESRMSDASSAGRDRRDRSMLSSALRKLHEEQEAELLRAGLGAATLSFRALRRPGLLAPEEIDAMLRDAPRIWARRMAEDYGVLRPRSALHTERAFAASAFSELDYLPALDALRGPVDALAGSIAALRAAPRAEAARDPQTGAGLAAAEAAVAHIADHALPALTADVAELGIARDAPALSRQYAYRIRELEQLAAQAEAEADALQRQAADVFAPQILDGRRAARRHAGQAAAMRRILERIDAGVATQQDAAHTQQQLDAVLAELRRQAGAVARIHAAIGAPGADGGADQALYQLDGDGAQATAPPATERSERRVFAVVLAMSLVGAAIFGRVLQTIRSRLRPA